MHAVKVDAVILQQMYINSTVNYLIPEIRCSLSNNFKCTFPPSDLMLTWSVDFVDSFSFLSFFLHV